MKRASYRDAIDWIARMDESAEMDATIVVDLASVMLVAEIFGVNPMRVADDVVRKRIKIDDEE